MTARERVLASRLIQKIDHNESYAKQIGLSYMIIQTSTTKNKSVQKKEKKN